MKKTCLAIILIAIAAGCGESEPGDHRNDAGTRRDAALDGSMLSCLEVLVCVDACTSDPCIEACLTAATPDGVSNVTDLVACAESNVCGDDDVCLETHCGSELAACQGALSNDGGIVVLDGGFVPDDGDIGDASMPLPSRIEGTSRDFTVIPGSTLTLDSTASLVFVLDDVAGAAAGFPTATFAFYRLEHVEYHAVVSGSDGGCITSGESNETFTNPPAFENYLMVERAPGQDGLYGYHVSTSLSVNHPSGMLVTCPPPIPPSYGQFNAEHNLTSGTSNPRSDGTDFVGATTISIREFSWDLHRVD